MKCCPYCGAEYPDEMRQCPIDHESLAKPALPASKLERQDKHEIPAPPAPEDETKWVTIQLPRDEFEANIVFNKLRLAGIRVRSDDAVMGGGLYIYRMRGIQVRAKDYARAKKLLNDV